MLTRIEIDGFKTFENFAVNFGSFAAIVGPNASGKSNLFDAIRLLSLLAQYDIPTAMRDVRGRPEELFRHPANRNDSSIRLAIEVLLPPHGEDAFGQHYEVQARRLRYEISIRHRLGTDGMHYGLYIEKEHCNPIKKTEDSSPFVKRFPSNLYKGNRSPFIEMTSVDHPSHDAIRIRQDGPNKRGRPLVLSANDATRSGLSSISTAEFPHLYALKTFLSSIQFLQIDPVAARTPSDRLASRVLEPNASNLATVLARLQSETASRTRPNGVLADIAGDLSSLINSVRSIEVRDDVKSNQYDFDLLLEDDVAFSSRVISDGTLRLLALITLLRDPKRSGILCFEEPENGVHEGRVPQLINLLRDATNAEENNGEASPFQILTNTHSPAVMKHLKDEEIIAADLVTFIDPNKKVKRRKTRMRSGIKANDDIIEPGRYLTRFEIDRILQKPSESV